MMKICFSLILIFLCSITGRGQSKISVYTQTDSPLQISNFTPQWESSNDNHGNEIKLLAASYNLQNTGSKPIRAFTIVVFSGAYDKSTRSFSNLSMSTTPANVIRPGQTIAGETGKFGSSPSPDKIAVDFVEFTDGATWGLDTSESTDLLAGRRAGIKAAQEYLRAINQTRGIEAVIKALADLSKLTAPEQESTGWKREFKYGAGMIARLVKETYEKKGGKQAAERLQEILFLPV